MNDVHSGWDFGMGTSMTLFWLLLIVVIFLVVKKWFDEPSSQSKEDPATSLELLIKSYELGEIDQDEFEKIKKEIEL